MYIRVCVFVLGYICCLHAGIDMRFGLDIRDGFEHLVQGLALVLFIRSLNLRHLGVRLLVHLAQTLVGRTRVLQGKVDISIRKARLPLLLPLYFAFPYLGNKVLVFSVLLGLELLNLLGSLGASILQTLHTVYNEKGE